MSKTDTNDSIENVKHQVEELFVNEEHSKSSSEVLPMEEWSSLIVIDPVPSLNTKPLKEQGLRLSGSSEICAKYIQQSDSSVFRHPYYNYPPVLDPGIKEALLEPDLSGPPYPDDGVKLYMDLCDESNVCSVRQIYTNLLNSEINLRYYCLSSAETRIMATALQNNDHVKRLDLTDNYLDLDACYHLGEMLKCNRIIEELILDGCRIREAGLRLLASNMSANSCLKILSLAKNDLNDNGGELFAKIIGSGVKFCQVNLSYNKLGVKTANALSEVLLFGNNLTHLDISWNLFINVRSAVLFFKALAAASDKLQELNVSFMGLDDVRVANAIADVSLLPKLTNLNISDNRFSDDCAEILVSNLAASKLRTYNFSNNFFTPEGACSILRMLTERRVKLQNLYLDNICVNKNFMAILQDIRKMKSRKNFVVTFDKVLHDWIAVGNDPRSLILKRGDYLGKMKKKAPKDVPMFLLSLSHTADYIREKELIAMIKNQKIPIDDDWVQGLIQAFPGPLADKKPTINTKNMREYIKRIWPDLKLPPDWTPPVMIKEGVKNKKKK